MSDLDFTIHGEIFDNRLWVHYSVHRWSHRVSKRTVAAFHDITHHFNRDIWAAQGPGTPPHLPKLLKSFGFTKEGHIEFEEGPIFTWVFKNNGKFSRRDFRGRRH